MRPTLAFRTCAKTNKPDSLRAQPVRALSLYVCDTNENVADRTKIIWLSLILCWRFPNRPKLTPEVRRRLSSMHVENVLYAPSEGVRCAQHEGVDMLFLCHTLFSLPRIVP